jgi:hypothetical protein
MILLSASCRGSRIMPGRASASEPVVIYKTRNDYRNLVSVQLSADGKTVTAFPAPSDVRGQRPVPLADGYLLKRMVGDAFLSLSIEDYADHSPRFSAEELLRLIFDRDPYLEKYDCSNCTPGDTASINNMIRSGRLKECTSLINK